MRPKYKIGDLVWFVDGGGNLQLSKIKGLKSTNEDDEEDDEEYYYQVFDCRHKGKFCWICQDRLTKTVKDCIQRMVSDIEEDTDDGNFYLLKIQSDFK